MVSKGKGVSVVPKKMIELVEYQDGAVVSRTLIDKKAGTVTLFAFDEGERYINYLDN